MHELIEQDVSHHKFIKQGILLTVFSRMLSTVHIIQHPITGGKVSNELETMWKQAVTV
jgi:hypothetical protein